MAWKEGRGMKGKSFIPSGNSIIPFTFSILSRRHCRHPRRDLTLHCNTSASPVLQNTTTTSSSRRQKRIILKYKWKKISRCRLPFCPTISKTDIANSPWRRVLRSKELLIRSANRAFVCSNQIESNLTKYFRIESNRIFPCSNSNRIWINLFRAHYVLI